MDVILKVRSTANCYGQLVLTYTFKESTVNQRRKDR